MATNQAPSSDTMERRRRGARRGTPPAVASRSMSCVKSTGDHLRLRPAPGHLPADAEDLTQSFFAFVLERTFSPVPMPPWESCGTTCSPPFPSYQALAAPGQRAKTRRWEEMLSLGGSRPRTTSAFTDHPHPEMLYQRLCALRIIEAAVEQLAQEQKQAGKEQQFLPSSAPDWTPAPPALATTPNWPPNSA